MKASVVEVSVPAGPDAPPDARNNGYGRDFDEALTNAMWADEDAPKHATAREVEIHDDPGPDDTISAAAADTVCRYHVEEDPEVPDWVKAELRELLEKRMFAQAVLYCFDEVWDRGFEEKLDPKDRKYLP